MNTSILIPAFMTLASGALGQACLQEVRAPTADPTGRFGESVLLDGDTLIVGEPGNDVMASDCGAVHLFELNPVSGKFVHDMTLFPMSPSAGLGFGGALARSGDTLFIGAPGPATSTAESGHVEILTRPVDGWVFQSTLRPIAGSDAKQFGTALSADGDYVIVGSNSVAFPATRTNGGAWQLQPLIVTSTSRRVELDLPFACFEDGSIFRLDEALGFWVNELQSDPGIPALRGTRAVIAGSPSYAIRVYDRDVTTGAWMLSAQLADYNVFLPLGRTHAGFLGDQYFVSGSFWGVPGTQDVYFYDMANSTWEEERLYSGYVTPSTDANLGWAADFQAGVSAIGAPGYGGSEGRVDIIDQSCFPIGGVDCIQADANSTGDIGQIAGFGSSFISDNDVTVLAYFLPQNAFGMLLCSRTPGLTISPGGSSGDLCLAGSIGRFNRTGQIMSSGINGQISLDVDLGLLPSGGALLQAAAGETWFFQLWHREANPTLSSDFTNSLGILFQ